MAWDEIKFKISADLDFKDAVSQIQNVRSGIDGIKTSIEDMPNASKILNTSLEKTATIADSISGKLSKLETGDFKTSDDRKRLEASIQNDISELNALRKLQTGGGEFSTAIASSWFSGLPKAVQSELDAVIPKVSNIIRTRTSVLNKTGSLKGITPQALTKQLYGDSEIQSIAKSFKNSQSEWNFDTLISHLIPNVISRNKLDAYQLSRYGSLIQNERMALSKGKVLDLFPESFKQAYSNRGYSKKSFGSDMSGLVLDASSIQELNSMLASRPIMAKAALAAGISRRDSRGVLETKREITRDEWENYRAALYGELMDRISGYGKGKIDPYSALKNDVEKIESRLTSSTSGSVMNALHDIEKFENAGSWTTGTGSTKWRKLPQEGRRAMDQYVVTKYSPFLKTPTGGEVAPKEVMISESQNTRLLGRGQWKNNDDVSDTIAVVSLAGYDKNNKEHQAAVLDLYRNGRDFNGKHYIAQSSHGKDDDQIIRMIEESAYNRVSQEEAAFAAKHGIPGTYWKNFDDAEIARKMRLRQEHQEGAITAEDWGKHLEARNKAWTPTTDVGLNLNGKKIAVVDFQKMGDGATWVSNRMMADSGQVRLGVGGKGSSFVFDGKNVGEWARKSGLADAQGRIMMRGPDGNMYDVSDYDMLMPLDVIKNKGAYMNEDGTFKSGAEASKIATALGKRYGIGMLANYSKESHTSDNLGTQMASFIRLSPELRDRQVSMAMKRLEELDTEAGQLKYVFGDQNDWLSRKVNQDTQLLSTEAAQKRIDSHRQSILQDLIAGKYIDFGEGDSGIANMRLAASPLASYLLSHGGVTPEVIQKARGYIEADAKKKKVAVPQYTDEEISNMLIPDANTVLDFEHKDQDWLGVIRSPTGYGNMLYARNVARQAEPIYRGMGIATDAGIYISEQQRDTLQGADFDSDEAKVIYDEALRKDIEESVKNQPFEKAALDVKPTEYTDEQLLDEAQQNMLRNGMAADMGLAMGAGSSGIRIMQLDLSKPQNKKFIQQAQRLAAYYDYGTVQDKKPTDIDFSKVDAWEALGLGKEYTKFSDHADDLFSFEDDLLNSEGNPNEDYKNDVFKASNGELINLRRLRQMGVDNINLPAAFMSNHLMGVAEIGNLYQNGMVQTGRWNAISEAMDAMGYEDAGPARKKLMQTMRHMLPQFATGERTKLTDAEARALAAMSDAAENELREAASEYYNPDTGEYVASDGRPYKSLKNFVEYQGRRYGIQTARNASRHFGITDSRLNAMFGEEYASQRYKNAGVSDIDLLPEDLNREVYQQKEEQLNQAIQEAHEKVEQEQRASSKQRSRRRNRTKSKSSQSEAETESQTRLNELLQEREQLQREVAANQRVIDLRNEYNSLMSDAREYNNQLWGYQKGKENKINDTKSFAEKYYGRSFYQAEEQLKPLTEFKQKLEASGAPQEVISELTQGINNVRSDVTSNVQRDFANKAILYSKTLAEDLENKNIAPSRQKQTLDQYEESIQNAQSFVDFMQKSLEKGDVKPEQQKQYEDAIAQTTDYVARARVGKSQLQQTYTKTNEEASRQAIENLEIQYGLRNRNSYQVRSERRLRSISDQRDLITKQHAEGNFTDTEFEEANKRLDKLQKRSSEVSLAMQDMGKTALSGITAPIKMLANQFERQIFQSAIKEVKRFITDYNKSMTEIQMITLKSDTQIQNLGKNLIDTAKEMKISVSEVTNSAATLYRQGLSDEEVSDRLEVISKFSKVSGTKVDAATKLITVAMNTGLVDNATTAADIVTALGDSAATNASEIEKGIEKAGAAAAADGTTFGQLAAMLTAITSTTQIGGNVAGRTLNTIFGRMNKIGTNELIYDENGNAISGSAVAKLLQAQGINMYDANGNKRSTFDTLYALSQRWEGMADAEQQQIANAIAGTRQYSNFAAIMQGMSEGKIDEYLELIGESSGITDKKFDVYAKSLEASVTNLRNTFDGLINDLTDSGALTGFIDDLAGAIQGVDNLANGISNLTGGMGGLAALVPTVLPMLAGLALLKAGVATANLPMILAGLAAASVGYGIASIAGSYTPAKSSSEIYAEQKASSLSRYNDLDSKLTRATELNNKSDRTEAEDTEFKSLLKDISLFNTLSGALDSATTSAEGLATSIDGMASSANDAAAAIKAAKDENDKRLASDIIKGVEPQAEGIVTSVTAGIQGFNQTARSSISGMNGVLWTIDDAGNMQLLDNESIVSNITQLSASPEGNQKIRSLAAFLDEATSANGFEVPEQYKEYGAAGWEDILRTMFLENPDIGIGQDFWRNVLNYAIGTYTSADDPKNVLRQQLQESLQGSLSGIIPTDQISGAVGYVTNRVLSLSKDGQVTTDIVSQALNDLYGLDLQRPDSYQLESIKQSAQQKSWTWQQYESYIHRNQALAEERGQVIPPLDFETWRKIEKPELNYPEQVSSSESTQLEEVASDIFSQAAYSYQSWKQDSKNAYALTADSMYRALRNSGATTAKELNDYIQVNNLQKQFEQLYSNDEFGRLMSQVQYNTETGEILYAPDDFVNQVMSFLLSNGLTYGAPNLTVAQKGRRALEAFNGLQNKGWYRSLEEKEEAILSAGSDEARVAEITTRGALTPDEQNYLKEALGESLYQDFISGNTGFGANELIQQILTNRANGYTDFTTKQKLSNIDAIRAIAKQNELDFSNETYLLQMLSGFSGAQEWINLQKIKGTEDYEDLGGDVRLAALEHELDTYVQELMKSDIATALEGINGFSESLTETALKNKTVLETGNAAEQLAMITGFASNASAAQNAQYYLDRNSVQSASALAAYLGTDESSVSKLLKTDDGKKKLQEAINAQAVQMYASIAAALGADLGDFNLDTADLSSAKAMLLSAAETVEAKYRDFLISLANGITDSGQIVAQVTNSAQQGYESALNSLRTKGNEQAAASWFATQDFSSYYGQTVTDSRTVIGTDGTEVKETFERAITFAEALQAAAESANQNFDLYSLFTGNETITALGGLWNRGMLSNATASSYFSDLGYGVSPGADFASNLGRDLFGGDLFSSGMFDTSQIEEIRARYQELVSGAFGPEAQALVQTFIGIWGDLNTALSQEDAKEAAERLKDLGEQFSSRKAAEADKYSNSLTKIQKETEKLQKATALQDQKYAAGRIRGKSGKQLKGKDLEEFMAAAGIPDKKTAQKASKELVDEVANAMESEADKTFTEQMIKPALKTFFDGVEKAINDDSNPLTLDKFIEIRTEFEKTGDAGAFLEELNQYIESEYLEPLRTWEGLLAELTINGEIEKNSEDLHAWFEGFLNEASAKLKKPSSYSGGGKGGGGGGGGSEKSPVQKLLEKQKHETTEAQHTVKMQEIYQTHYDFVNDYDSYISSLGAEEEAYNNLSAMYQRHIGELESMLGGLSAYSDEWWQVKEALDAAKESLADVQNKIDAIETKRVEIIVQKQENEDKPSTQKQSLWTEKARGYQIRGQFESYAVSEGKRIEEIDEQRKLNEQQIEELEKTLAQTTEGSDAWLKARDQIWTLQVENAQLANDQEEARRALQLATVEQAKTDLTNRLTPRDHETSLLSTYGTLYQNNRQYEDYRASLAQRNTVTQENVDLYTQYRDKITEQMKTLEEGSEAWYAARDAIFEYDEAIAQATLSIDENNRAIEQNRIDELKKNYELVNQDLSHTDNILKTQQDRYDKNNNFTMYQAVLAERVGVTTNKIVELEKQLQGYLNLQGLITEGTDAWDDLKSSAQSTAEELESAKSALEELERLQSQSKFEHDQEIFERQDNLDQHTLRMIQYEESMYQNRGEYRNQNIMLQRENELRAEMAQRELEYIDTLKEDLALTKEGSDEYYKIADAIYKAEENVKQHTNAIEKNTETMKKNEQQILKTYQTLINTIDTEIKQRVKEQREQLSAEVSIQNQILNVIRNRYKQEWQLVKADITEKKKALQQEKALINERLQARIQAEDTESKYAELSELQRQLTLIASDPTRTKDAKTLQKQIEDMEKELSRTRAQEEAKAEQERLNEEMKAYDQYVAYQEASLNQMLKDANSVPLYEELNAAMGTEDMSREDRIANYLDWLRQNDDNYKYGTEALRLQMEQSSTDSWNKMLGWIDTYWDQVHDIIDGGIDTILDYMKESSSYRFGEEEAGQKLLEWTWREQFENYVDSQKNDAEWNHTHEDIITDIQDEVFEINRGITDMYGLQKNLYHFIVGLQYDYIRPTDVDPDADKIDYRDYAGIGRKEIKVAGQTYTYSVGENPKKSGGSKQKYVVYLTDSEGNEYSINDANGIEIEFSSLKDAEAAAAKYLKNKYGSFTGGVYEAGDYDDSKKVKDVKGGTTHGLSGVNTPVGTTTTSKGETVSTSDTTRALEKLREMGLLGYSEGGLVGYTGIALVHGTQQRPEAFLSADDTKNIRALLDAFQYIKAPSPMVPSDKAFTGNYNVGDVNITINEAQISNDADLDRLATEIGRKFTKQLSKEGLNLTGYSW